MYLNFAFLYDKLQKEAGTTIRINPPKFAEGTEVFLKYNSRVLAKVTITRIERLRLCEIPLPVLREDAAPFSIGSHRAFAKFLSRFYPDPIDDGSFVFLIYWKKSGTGKEIAGLPGI